MGAISTTKILKQASGLLTEETVLTTSAGAADAQKIPALNAAGILDATIVNAKIISAGAADSGKVAQLDGAGKLDATVMPVGIGADTAVVVTSEILAAGDLVNIFNNAGTANVRKADSAASGKEAHGFVLVGFAAAVSATVYFEGTNTAVTSLTPGLQYLSGVTPGKSATSPATGTGKVVQQVGFATSATALNFNSGVPIVLA